MTPRTADPSPRPTVIEVRQVTAEDIKAALKDGVADFLARPVMSGFSGSSTRCSGCSSSGGSSASAKSG